MEMEKSIITDVKTMLHMCNKCMPACMKRQECMHISEWASLQNNILTCHVHVEVKAQMYRSKVYAINHIVYRMAHNYIME